MNCKRASSLMLDYLYGELDQKRALALENHLGVCKRCSGEFEAHKATVSAFAKLPVEEPGDAVTARIMNRAKAEKEEARAARREWSAWYWRPALAAAAAAALVIVCVVYYLPTAGKSGAPSSEMAAMKRSPASMKREESAKVALMKESVETAESRKKRLYPDATVDAPELRAQSVPAMKMPGTLETDAVLKEEARGPRPALSGAGVSEQYTEPDYVYSAPAEAAPRPTDDRLAADKSGEGMKARQNAYMMSRSLSDEAATKDSVSSLGKLETPDREVGGESEKKLLEGFERNAQIRVAQEELTMGNEYFSQHDFRQAAVNYQNVIELDPQGELVAEAKYRLAQTRQNLNQCEEAISLYNEVLEKYPGFPKRAEIYLAAGECYAALGDLEEALRNFEIVRDRVPEKREVAQEKIDLVIIQQRATTPAE